VGLPEWMADAFNELQADGRTLPGGWADVDDTPAEAAVRDGFLAETL
jgi:8-oxo-dGTP pyrophosphatase MutT (NUDIX family)